MARTAKHEVNETFLCVILHIILGIFIQQVKEIRMQLGVNTFNGMCNDFLEGAKMSSENLGE